MYRSLRGGSGRVFPTLRFKAGHALRTEAALDRLPEPVLRGGQLSTKSPLAFDGQHSGMLLSIPSNVSKL